MTLTTNECMVTLAEANTYASARKWADWAAAESSDKEAALRAGNEWLVSTFSWNDSGVLLLTQVQPWPRWGAFDREGRLLSGIPTQVKSAVIEAGRLWLASPITGGDALSHAVISETVGPISVTYANSSRAAETADRTAFITGLMRQIRASGGSGSNLRLVRG